MDPVSQTLAQQQSGSAGGQGFGSFLAQGIQLNQNQQRINQDQQQIGLANRRLQLMEAQERRSALMFPLEQAAMQHQAITTGVEAITNVQKAQIAQQNMSIMPKLLDLEMRFMQSDLGFADPVLAQELTNLTQKYPIAFTGDGQGKKLWMEMRGAQMWRKQMADYIKIDKQFREEAGATISSFQSNPETGALSVRAEPIEQQLPPEELVRRAQMMGMEPSTMNAEGDIGFSRPRSGQEFTATLPDGTVIRQGPTGGTGGATTSVRTASQRNLIDIQKTLTALNDVKRTLRPEDVGVKGVVGEELLDVWLPQLGFQTADVQRMDNRTKLKALAEGMLRDISDDSRFSNVDRAAIENIVPKAGVRTSYEKTISTIDTLSNVFAKRALIDAQAVGEPAPQWALEELDDVGLAESAKAGLITREQARMLYQQRRQQQ